MALSLITKQYPVFCPTLPDLAELQGQIQSVFDSGRLTIGTQVAALEEEVCAYTKVRNAIAVSSGTSGLMLLMRALDLPKGSEVITPSFTFAATSHALLWHGLKPVYCDSDAKTFTMDASAVEALVNERTSAIYPVNIFGVPGDLDAYRRIADKYHLALLFDSAQGLGSSYKDTMVGNFGYGEVFSMSPTKVVTAMEGGLITTNYDEIADKLRYMRDYGKAPDGEDMQWLGLSARMSEVNAVVARWSFARIGTWIDRRAAIMTRYRERLHGIPGISFQHVPAHCSTSRNYIVILLDPEKSPISRDTLYRALKEDGIQTKRYFYPAVHNQSLFRDLEPGCASRLRIAERISQTALALPMYSHMEPDAVEEICDRICYHCGI